MANPLLNNTERLLSVLDTINNLPNAGSGGGGSGSEEDYLLQIKEVTPTKSKQIVTKDPGYYGLASITVNSIPDEYITTSDATATEGTILLGETAYVDGELVTGKMPNNGTQNLTIDLMTTDSVDIQTGYTSGGIITVTDDLYDALMAI